MVLNPPAVVVAVVGYLLHQRLGYLLHQSFRSKAYWNSSNSGHTTRVRYPYYIPNDEDVATIEQIAHYHSIEIVDAIDQFVQVEILADEEDADEEDVDSEYEEDEEEVEEDSEEEVTVVERPPKKTRTCEYSYGILCVWCLNDCALYLIQFCLYLSIYYFHFINTSPRNCFQ